MRDDGVLVGVMLRGLVLAAGLVMLPAAAFAAPTPPADAPAAHNGGTIQGRLTSVDFQQNVLAVDAEAHGRMWVDVMPSTSIQGKDSAYHTITDLKPGMHVQIDLSILDGKNVAQIIRIMR